ncbi:MAG: coproporphyrinogen III oxidase, partial [Rhodospirillales bacterium]|nr:coproporphyrinogen III oxidase [Rhodospirillales bacterium]
VVQQAINRIQPYDVTKRVIAWLRDYGVPEINMDLIYGLPFQSVDSLMHTIDQAVGFTPRRLSLFGYAHVPWMKKHQRLIPEDSLPDLPERWRQYEAAGEHLKQHGYVQVGLDHFARPEDELAVALRNKRLHRNFQGYTTDAAPALIGFGASGIGSLPQGYVANEGGIHAYKDMIRHGHLTTTRGIAVSEDDKLRRHIIERIMCDLEIDLDAVCVPWGVDAGQFEPELASLAGLVEDGVVVRQGRKLAVTDDGRPLVRAVCAAFDRYLKKGEQRHSKAI